MKTVGISPKLYGAVLMAVLGYLLTQQLVDFPALVDLLINVLFVGGGVAVAGPGDVEVTDVERSDDLHGSARPAG